MKKRIIPALLACLVLSSCGQSQSGQVAKDDANVFPASTKEDSLQITMGDVMPFYDGEVMNIYHLRNTTGTNSLFYHPISRLTTTDFIHYKDEGIALNYEEQITSVDAALGTGSFIKDAVTGYYHCFYTGHNDKAHDDSLKDAGLIKKECIRHAISKDNQQTWEKVESFIMYGYEDDFRDPYVYYDDVDQKYYMLITTRDFGHAVIRRYGADTLDAKPFDDSDLSWKTDEWNYVDNFFTNDAGDYNMECPSYIKYGNYYYLAYSEQGANRVTHYRYKKSRDGEWKKFPRDAIDASGFYAGRLELMNNKLYAFAWCARLTGGNTGDFDWAGNLVTHELKQGDDGELFAVMPQTYKDFFKTPVNYGESKEYTSNGEGFIGNTLKTLSTNVTRLSYKMTIKELSGDFGITFGIDNDFNNRLGDGLVAFNLNQKKIACHNNVSNILRYGPELTSVSYEFEIDTEYVVDVIADEEVVSLYLNNEVALTSRLVDMEENYFGFYFNEAKVEMKEVMFYE